MTITIIGPSGSIIIDNGSPSDKPRDVTGLSTKALLAMLNDLDETPANKKAALLELLKRMIDAATADAPHDPLAAADAEELLRILKKVMNNESLTDEESETLGRLLASLANQ